MSKHSPEWTQYILGMFMPDELDNGNPRVEGLRRVSGLVLGDLVEEGCDLVSPPSNDNNFRACVKAWGVFVDHNGIRRRFEAIADANENNCTEDFQTYIVAMADTRAKGRMFRNALCLRRVVAAEEINKSMFSSSDIQEGGHIHEGQISMIRILTDRMGLPLSRVLSHLEIASSYKADGDVDLKKLSYDDAVKVAKFLNEIRQDKEAIAKIQGGKDA